MRISLPVVTGVGVMWIVGGLVYPLLGVVTKDIDALSLAATRTAGAAVLMTAFMLLFRRSDLARFRVTKAVMPDFWAAMAFYPIGNATLAFASQRIASGMSALVFSLMPVLACLWAIREGNRLSIRTWLGVGLSVTFLAVLGGGLGGSIDPVGMLTVVGSVFVWFAGTTFWVKNPPDYPVLVSVWLQIVFGAIGCALFIPFAGLAPASVAFNWPMLLLMLTLAGQHIAYIGIAERISPILLTSFAFVNPLVAAIAGWLLLGEVLTSTQIVTATLLLGSIWLVVTGEQSRSAQRQPEMA